MTIAELNRYTKSWQRREKQRAQEIAVHNYILAGLIGRNMAGLFSQEVEMPKLEEVYSSLFEDKAEDTKRKQEELATELAVARFKQFANLHNENFKK
jgi:hypothetical protein